MSGIVPSAIRATSGEVPPTARVRMFLSPELRATHSAPATPPAGPDISSDTGCASDASDDISPPSERSSEMRPCMSSARSRLRRLRT